MVNDSKDLKFFRRKLVELVVVVCVLVIVNFASRTPNDIQVEAANGHVVDLGVPQLTLDNST